MTDYQISVQLPSFTYEIDPQEMAEAIAEGMRDSYVTQMSEGRQPDGSPLPLNAEGKPLGKGNGSIIRGWTARGIRASRRVGRAFTAPGQDGKLAIAVRILRRRGVKFQGTTGAAAEALARLISDESSRQHRSALQRGRKK